MNELSCARTRMTVASLLRFLCPFYGPSGPTGWIGAGGGRDNGRSHDLTHAGDVDGGPPPPTERSRKRDPTRGSYPMKF